MVIEALKDAVSAYPVSNAGLAFISTTLRWASGIDGAGSLPTTHLYDFHQKKEKEWEVGEDDGGF